MISKQKLQSVNMNDPTEILILVDFDGTITRKDVGALLFDTYSKKESEKIVSQWIKGEIGSRECLKRECELIQITEPELKKFALSQKIDGKFPAFVDLCKREHLKLVILSDGLDFYIKLILEKFGLGKLPFYSNTLRFDGGKIKPEFPHFDRGCGNCGNCKRYHLKNLKGRRQKIVYIGDGLSDKCAAREADFIFAKNDLRRFCLKKAIKHYPFRHFGDVIRQFNDLVLNHKKAAGNSDRVSYEV